MITLSGYIMLIVAIILIGVFSYKGNFGAVMGWLAVIMTIGTYEVKIKIALIQQSLLTRAKDGSNNNQ